MANSPLPTAEYLREALRKTCNCNPDVSDSLVYYCERADVTDAAEYLHNIIQGDGEHVIDEYVRRRSLGKQTNKDDSPGEPMQIYKKPEVSLSTPKPMQTYKKPEVFSSKPVAGKTRKKLTPGTQSLKNASFVSKDNQHGVSGKEHTDERVAKIINPTHLRQREKCDCQAREHKLVNNCLECGRIVCEKEGEGRCMFCGRSEIWHHSSPSRHLRGPAEEAEDRAIILKNKLLEQDRQGNLQTTIIDDQSDLFNIEENTWMSPEERLERKKQQIILDEAESVRRNRTVFRLGADVGEVDFTTEDAIQQSDSGLHSAKKEAVQIIGLREDPNRQQSSDTHSANKRIVQTSRIKANPSIQEIPVYVSTEKPAKHNGRMEDRRMPESMKVRSGRVQHDDPLFRVPSLPLRKGRDVFDICLPNNDAASQGEGLTELSLSLYAQTKVKKQNSENCKGPQILRPGMVLLKKWLNENDQIEIVKICQQLGVDKGGFYQPAYEEGSKMHLWMMCLGKNWDPESRSYEDVRSYDNEKPPSLPSDFIPLVRKAIRSAHDEIKNHSKLKEEDVQNVLPFMKPDVCIVNFYKESGRLGLHQDKDESSSSLQKGLPVVSFSVGDAAEFLYGTERDPEKAEKIILESGDVLIFGGESRHVFHGISVVKPNTFPKSLLQKTRLCRGRLNLTFRQI
ncbi:hypothetical protein SUGI_0242230 [Cryptomeria japonica]|uniref:uncharacterized protein LOC131049384 n=1 Tax=Cryptomeria japonica TaxID=3369 RepID=UPI002408A1B9|nr:uncharacterized protein LOC131049384 [Cryptomeria japonica]GLJ14889.1 hypothetical protein SUGI_0242230 [Cryptomeria japonica]